jgi:hypothetical protein
MRSRPLKSSKDEWYGGIEQAHGLLSKRSSSSAQRCSS